MQGELSARRRLWRRPGCDGFGRCVAARPVDAKGAPVTFSKSTSVAPPVSDAPQGQVALSGVPLELVGVGTLGGATLSVTDGGVAGALVQAPAGVEVQCAPSDAFAASCTVPPLEGGATWPLGVRVTDATMSNTWDVALTTPTQALSFRVRYTKDTTPTAAPLEGTYQGFARLSGLGSVARTQPSALPAPLAELTVPVTLTIYREVGGARVVELSDAFGVLFPDAKTVGQVLRDANNNLQLRLGATAFVASDGVDVAVSASSTFFEKGLNGLSVSLRTTFGGVIDDASAPAAQWQLSLTRTAELPVNATPPPLPTAYVPADVTTRATTPFGFEAAVLDATKATALTGALQAQAVLCTPPGAMTPTRFATSISTPSWTGDLSCTGGGATPAEQLAYGIVKDTVWQVGPIVARCMSDLRAGPGPGDGSGCLALGRAITALDLALEVDRQTALGIIVPADELRSSIGHRVLQQYLRTHLFVAKQARQIDELNDVLTTEDQVPRNFQQTEMLELTGHAFDLVLHPRIAMGLSRLNRAVLLEPDYRVRFAPGVITVPNPRHEQADGLPVTLMDTLRDYLGVYASLYERARFNPQDRVALEASAQRFLRKSLVVAALAVAMSDSAHAHSTTTPAWEVKWGRALGQFGTAFAALERSIDNLRSGRNPLDIDDKLDLPLYRVGDQSGALSRFSAVSDFLLGTASSLDTSAIVPSKIADAQLALDAARAALVGNQTQDFAAAQAASDLSGRLEAIRRKYGEQIQSLCGDPALNADTVLLQDLDPETCFVKPDCRASPADRIVRSAPGDVARAVCQAVQLTQALGSGTIPGMDLRTIGAYRNVATGIATVTGQSVTTDPSGAVQGVTVHTALGDVDVPAAVFDARVSAKAALLTAAQHASMRALCEPVAQKSEALRAATVPQACSANAECPSGLYCDQSIGHCANAADSGDRTACYSGAIGGLVVAIRSAKLDVEAARADAEALTRTWQLTAQKCFNDQLAGDQQVAAQKAFTRAAHDMASAKLAFDLVTIAAEGVSNCASTAGSENKFGTAAAVACVAEGVAVVSKSVSAGLEFGIDDAARSNELLQQTIANNNAKANCQLEVDMATVGFQSAGLRAQKALQDMTNQYAQLEDLKNAVRVAMRDGREALLAETQRTVPGIAMDFWLSDKVERYSSTFRAARRVTYLGVLAVEYEYQVSTIERQNVLAATTVAQLQTVLERLRNLVATGTVRGRAPADLHTVVSLREHLLQLADQSTTPPGSQQLSDTQRFQLLLTSPRFAVYDANGRYLGQELPFSVAPLAALRLGNSSGVPLLSSTDCSERVWSLNATLHGTDLMEGGSTRPRLSVKKRNRFYSQWCTPSPDGTDFQVSATRPSRNLFLDPFTDYLPGAPGASPATQSTINAAAEADAFASARLQPELNVSQADFESDEFFNGSSTELAGRGLYGDYALFFPADSLSINGATGLKLEHLDDVLLRFDYVSVAQ
ncbi:MAG: hypothetical protein ACOZQL_09870 [Myxococcota bacterium]